jgi:hypothetical protein
MQAVSNLPAIGVEEQIPRRVAANNAIQSIIVLHILNLERWVAVLKMEECSIVVSRGVIIVAENPVVVVHLGRGEGQGGKKKEEGV